MYLFYKSNFNIKTIYLLLPATDFFTYLCVPLFTGDLLLVDVENKDIAFSKRTESKITSLVWVQQEKSQKKETIDSVLIKVVAILLLHTYL